MNNKLIGSVFLIASLLLWFAGPFVTIPAGSRGVVTHFGKVQDEVLDEGFHLVIPLVTSVHKISLRVQKSEDTTEAATKDMQKVHASITLNWHVNANALNKMYQTVGNVENIDVQIIGPAVSEVLKAATAKMTAEEVLTKRIELKQTIDDALVKRLGNYNVIVDDVSLTNLDFTTEFNHAVEAKQVAEQNAKRAEYITIQAKHEAEAAIEKAKGQAESQKLLKSSITKEILQQRAIEKWDGQFPKVMSSGTLPFINISTEK